jgi:hypothetical protein
MNKPEIDKRLQDAKDHLAHAIASRKPKHWVVHYRAEFLQVYAEVARYELHEFESNQRKVVK